MFESIGPETLHWLIGELDEKPELTPKIKEVYGGIEYFLVEVAELEMSNPTIEKIKRMPSFREMCSKHGRMTRPDRDRLAKTILDEAKGIDNMLMAGAKS